MKDFGGKVAVVTGAASGIGRAIALRLRDEGMRLVLADIDAAALDAFIRELAASGAEAIGVRSDVSRREAVEALAKAALDAFGGVHLVCNNAGIHGPLGEPVWQASEADWQRVMGVNLWGVVHGVGVFLPILAAQEGETHIVNTASATGLVAGANMYSVSKHAVISYTEAVFSDLNQQRSSVGISVLCPGFANTALLDEPPEPRKDAPKRRKNLMAMLARSSLKLAMPPEQVAESMVQGVRANQLYIMTDHAWDALARERTEDALSGQNPKLTPGSTAEARWPWARPGRPGG